LLQVKVALPTVPELGVEVNCWLSCEDEDVVSPTQLYPLAVQFNVCAAHGASGTTGSVDTFVSTGVARRPVGKPSAP
jgi:hypothetical protein